MKALTALPTGKEVSVEQAFSLKAKIYTAVISSAGAIALGYSLYRLRLDPVRPDWMLSLILIVMVTWRVEVYIPGVRSKLTLTDTLIYIGALMLGPWAATIIGSIDAVVRSFRGIKRVRTMGINVAAMSLSVMGASLLATKIFGPLDRLVYDSQVLDKFVLALGVLALTNYLLNTSIVAIAVAFWRGKSVIKTWREDYLWTSTAFFTGMVVSGVIAKAITVFGFYSFLLSLPILLLTYFTYKIYLGKVEASNQHIEKLTKLHLATIEALTMAIDAKDQMARGHIHRVRVMAECLARAVGYPEDQIEGLKTAALLHDIGKLAVPEHILNKPGKLSSAEYSKIMIHPVVGADILSNVEFPYEVVPIVKHHHEKYDGTGYPSHLKGKDIPFGARILTVVDCYDALTTTRAYRPCYNREQALEMMRRESGRTFDPIVLEEFFGVLDTIEELMPVLDPAKVSMAKIEPVVASGPLFEDTVESWSRTRTEKALGDIAAAQQEVLSLYEISQTLGATLKISEVLPIIASKIEKITNFTTLVIYLAEGNSLRAAHALGKHAELLKGEQMNIGDGGAGWVAERRQVLIGGSPLADLQRSLGREAARYRSTAIFPLIREDLLVGALALYSEEDRGYSADEVRLLETISCHAATALCNAVVFERTQESALTDNLTGLPNSRYMYSYFDQERSRAERHGYPLVLMMMDLDGFKKINDTYGHHIGDEILRRIAQTARAQLRTDDTLIRYAGDEFVAVLHRATPEVALDLKVRLQEAVDNFGHEVRPGRLARVGISIGYAVYGEDGHGIEELMELADQRMYEDKLVRKRGMSAVRAAPSQRDSIGI